MLSLWSFGILCLTLRLIDTETSLEHFPIQKTGAVDFFRIIGVFGAHYKMSVSRIRLSELEDFQLNLIEMRYNIWDWIQLAQGRVNHWTAVKAVKIFTVQ